MRRTRKFHKKHGDLRDEQKLLLREAFDRDCAISAQVDRAENVVPFRRRSQSTDLVVVGDFDV